MAPGKLHGNIPVHPFPEDLLDFKRVKTARTRQAQDQLGFSGQLRQV
jgi:hypothetical protein